MSGNPWQRTALPCLDTQSVAELCARLKTHDQFGCNCRRYTRHRHLSKQYDMQLRYKYAVEAGDWVCVLSHSFQTVILRPDCRMRRTTRSFNPWENCDMETASHVFILVTVGCGFMDEEIYRTFEQGLFSSDPLLLAVRRRLECNLIPATFEIR